MVVQLGLCQTWSETLKTGLVVMQLLCSKHQSDIGEREI